jgi:tetratricopeptide (TPR) repeat protein
MRRPARMIMLAAVLLVAVPASAQRIATIGKVIPDDKIKLEWDRGEEEIYLFRELRGGIAVFYFWRSRNLDSVERLAEMTALHGKYRDKGVRFISVTADKKEKFEEVARERDFSAFRYWFWNATVLYHMLGALSDPYVVLIDPRGVLAWRGVPDKGFEQRLADLIAETNPPIGDPKWLDRRYRQAQRLHDQRDYGKAYTIARALYKMTDESHSAHEKARALMERCEGAAEEWLREAIQAERDKDLEKAARIVAEIAVRFEDPDEDEDDRSRRGDRRDDNDESIKRKAEIEIGRMNGNRELKKLIREAQNNAEGQVLNDQAAALEEDDYYVDAKRIYEKVIKDYEDTDAAKEAKRRLKRIERDKSIQQKIAERRSREQAIRWLDIGDRFAAMELYDEAREHYERLVKEHPDTTAATRAKERLSKLPKAKDTAKAGADKETARADGKP